MGDIIDKLKIDKVNDINEENINFLFSLAKLLNDQLNRAADKYYAYIALQHFIHISFFHFTSVM